MLRDLIHRHHLKDGAIIPFFFSRDRPLKSQSRSASEIEICSSQLISFFKSDDRLS